MVLLSVLPPALAAAIPSIRWPLDSASSPPLYFESLESLKAIRKQPPPLLEDLPALVETLFSPADAEKRHFGLVATALILIGNGFTDECHNLITPLSWPDDIHFAYGPSVYSQVSAEARAYATYAHCLVHRREAFNVGEFGMVGFANANYWSNAVVKSPGVDLLPHREIIANIRNLAKQDADSQAWAQQHLTDESFFESRAVHELCARVLRGQDDYLRDFAEKVAETEVGILLGNALQKAGFDATVDSILAQDAEDVSATECITSRKIDETTALTAARKVSAAHLANFQSSGFITLRQVMTDGGDTLSAAAGITCRLMNSPACRLLREAPKEASQQRAVRIVLPTSELEAQTINDKLGSVVGSLSPLDLIAVTASVDSLREESDTWLQFVPCETNDSALFVDPLFETRGETPTTVVQWSKGTIF